PGPGVLSTAGVGVAFGAVAGLRYVAGLMLGNNLVALAVISGVAASALAVPGLRQLLLIASVVYLSWLALQIARSGKRIGFITQASAPGWHDGVLLQLINPKAYVVNTALFTGFSLWPDQWWLEVTIKLLVFNLLWLPIHLLWLWAGLSLRKLELSDANQARINLGMAAAMMGVVLLALLG
ncbi:MAG: LysE family translocator, partial [Granulosicoccaceae bacterium]